jgi:hypothetical protein
VALLGCSGVSSAQHWLPVPTPPTAFNAGGIALQLTDGTIMVQHYDSSTWWKLTPDEHADYTNGTWSKLEASRWPGADGTTVNYAPLDFASVVLPNGKVIVVGGEYNWPNGDAPKGTRIKVLTSLGAIFDPTSGPKGHWTPRRSS